MTISGWKIRRDFIFFSVLSTFSKFSATGVFRVRKNIYLGREEAFKLKSIQRYKKIRQQRILLV